MKSSPLRRCWCSWASEAKRYARSKQIPIDIGVVGRHLGQEPVELLAVPLGGRGEHLTRHEPILASGVAGSCPLPGHGLDLWHAREESLDGRSPRDGLIEVKVVSRIRHGLAGRMGQSGGHRHDVLRGHPVLAAQDQRRAADRVPVLPMSRRALAESLENGRPVEAGPQPVLTRFQSQCPGLGP